MTSLPIRGSATIPGRVMRMLSGRDVAIQELPPELTQIRSIAGCKDTGGVQTVSPAPMRLGNSGTLEPS